MKTDNSFDTCLIGIKGVMIEVLTAAEDGFTKNWLDLAKNLLYSGSDAIQGYQNCMNISQKDWFDWLDWSFGRLFSKMC